MQQTAGSNVVAKTLIVGMMSNMFAGVQTVCAAGKHVFLCVASCDFANATSKEGLLTSAFNSPVRRSTNGCNQDGTNQNQMPKKNRQPSKPDLNRSA